jgi:DHA1 family bicyclomycin/chloramphenicol resistance-like MFS transporter
MASDASCLAASKRAPVSTGFMALLAAMSALAPMSLQIFVPALPAIQAHFAVSPGVAQLALSLSILANAVAALSYGPLSDRFGRRPVVLAGLAMFIAGTVLCALAPTIGVLIVGRIVQSGGGAAGMVIARAIVRDLYAREQAASMIAYLTMAMVVAPMLAPSIGALLLDLFEWHAIFVALTGVGLLLIWRAQRRLAETRAGGSGGAGWSALLSGTAALMRSTAFIAYVLQSTFAISVFFAFVAGAPYYMIDILHRPATEYGLWFIVVSLGFMAGNFITARLGRRIGLDRLVLLGSWLVLLGIVLAAGLTLGGLWTPIALFCPMMLATFGNGLSIPNAQAGAVSVDPLLAGTASGLSGFTQMLVAALVSQAVGMLQNGTPYPMLGFMVGCAAISLLGFVLPRRLAGLAPAGPPGSHG